MRVIKPQQLSLLSRPFEFRQRMYCGFSVLSMLPMDGEQRMLHEAELWTVAVEAMGDQPVLDEGIPKRRGEYLLCGHAYPMDEARKTHSRVRLQVGPLTKALNVFGERHFDGDRITPPQPFERVPLDWRHAFGGEGHAYNPLGRGIHPEPLEDGRSAVCLPNVEYPEAMQLLPSQRVQPACPGPVDMAWKQRMRMAGTYDAAWLKQHYPGMAPDVDWRFFNRASEDQQLKTCWAGNEAFQLDGVHPTQSRISGQLPGIRARCFLRRVSSEDIEQVDCQLTTLWFFPDQQRVVLIHQGMARIEEPDASDISELMLAAEWLDRARPAEHYARVLSRRLDKDSGLMEALRDEDLMPEGMERGYPFDPAAMLEANNEAYRMRNLRERGERRMADAEAELDKLGMNVEYEHPASSMAELSMPKTMDELPDFIDKLQADAEIQLARVKAEGEQAVAGIEQAMTDLGPGAVNVLEKARAESGSPPRETAKMAEAALRKDIEQLGLPDEQRDEMISQLLTPQMIEMFAAREQSAMRQYLRSAHLTPAAVATTAAAEAGRLLCQRLAAGEDCRNQDFTGADLRGADLRGAMLDGVFLEGADLGEACLSGASLKGAVLTRANFTGADLSAIVATEANLGKAILHKAQCAGANLDQAILAEADLREADLTGASLKDADLAGVRLDGTCLDGVIAEGVLFMDREMSGVRWRGANISKAAFLRVDLSRSDFSGCHLTRSAFVKCIGHQVVFSQAEMANVAFADSCDFSEADFSGARMEESNLRETQLDRTNFEAATVDRSDFSGASLQGARLYRMIARQTQWVKADLREANCAGANLMQANLERADLRGASLKGANLFQADLARAHVDRQTDFSDCLTRKMRIHPKRFREELS